MCSILNKGHEIKAFLQGLLHEEQHRGRHRTELEVCNDLAVFAKLSEDEEAELFLAVPGER